MAPNPESGAVRAGFLEGLGTFSLFDGGCVWRGPVLLDRVRARKRELVTAGVRSGDISPVVADLSATGIVDLLALWRLGAVPALVNPAWPEREARAAREAPSAMAAPGISSRSGRPVAALRTSGSSGTPAYVTLGEGNVVAHVRGAKERLGLGPENVWLASLSTAHVGGLMTVIRALALGSGLATAGPGLPTAERIALAIEGKDGAPPVSHLSLVPTQLARLLELWGSGPPPDGLRCVLVGGASAPSRLVDGCLEAGWPLALTYGMTETSSQVATATPEEVRRKPGSVGKPLLGLEVSVTDEGEVAVRGATVAVSPGADGWYRTGDYGRFDEDDDLWITGRRADRVVSGGVTVACAEVETALGEHPAVAEICVVGCPDDLWGQRVAACVVPVEGEFDLAELQEWARIRLAPSHRPRRWRLAARLPVNANGKVDRRGVARRVCGSGS